MNAGPKRRPHFAIRKGDVYKACLKCSVINLAHHYHECPKNGRRRRPGKMTGPGFAQQQTLLRGLLQRCGGKTMKITSVGAGETVLGYAAADLLQQIQAERVEEDEEEKAAQ